MVLLVILVDWTPTVISKGARVVCLDQIFSSIDTNVRPLLGQF